jgi:hypothetical protein
MRLFQLLLLFLAGVFIRRLWLAARRRRPAAPPRSDRGAAPGEDKLENLTQQGISDADYEEIP